MSLRNRKVEYERLKAGGKGTMPDVLRMEFEKPLPELKETVKPKPKKKEKEEDGK